MKAQPVAASDYPEAGIHVAYYEAPYRHYTLTTRPPCPIALSDEKAVSVTTGLGVINKPSLVGWAANITATGAWTLARIDGYTMPEDMRVPKGARAFQLPPNVTDSATKGRWIYKWAEMDAIGRENPASLVRVYKDTAVLFGWRLMAGHLRLLGLDHRSTTGEAAERGVDVHQVWQDWNESQIIPNIAEYPVSRHGYIRGLSRFIMEHSPEAVETEQVVGSAVHGFAGRLDTVVVIGLGGERTMIDLKTSKGVYPNTHYPQLAGYELARRECGLEPSTRQGILRVGSDGKYQLGLSKENDLDDDKAWSDATPDDFLAVLSAYKSQQRWARR